MDSGHHGGGVVMVEMILFGFGYDSWMKKRKGNHLEGGRGLTFMFAGFFLEFL